MSSRAERDAKVFQGPATENAGALVEKAHCISAGLHDDSTWASTTYQNFTLGDMMMLAGFHERKGPISPRPMKLEKQEILNITKALELQTGMNYAHPEHDPEYACNACCTCVP